MQTEVLRTRWYYIAVGFVDRKKSKKSRRQRTQYFVSDFRNRAMCVYSYWNSALNSCKVKRSEWKVYWESQHSTEVAHKVSRPQRVRRKQSKMKEIMIIAYDKRGVIVEDWVSTGTSVTVAYYQNFLKNFIQVTWHIRILYKNRTESKPICSANKRVFIRKGVKLKAYNHLYLVH